MGPQVETKFRIAANKVIFTATNEAKGVSESIKDVKGLEDVLVLLLKKMNMTIFDIIQVFKNGAALSTYSRKVPKSKISVTFGKKKFKVDSGMTIEEVLGQHPEVVVVELEKFYYNYFKTEFSATYKKALGV